MKNVQIRNVPDKTLAVLKRRAAAAGMSLQEYLLGIVNEAAATPTVAELLQRADKRSAGSFRLENAVEDLQGDRSAR